MALEQNQFYMLQQQMQEYNRVVIQQQQFIMQLLEQQQQQNRNEHNIHWPSLHEAKNNNNNFLLQRNQSVPKQIFNNSRQNEYPPNRSGYDSRRRKNNKTPRNIYLGDFMSNMNRQQPRISKKKQVRFSDMISMPMHGQKEIKNKNSSSLKKKKEEKNLNRKLNINSSNVSKGGKTTNVLTTDSLKLYNKFLPLSIDLSDDNDENEVETTTLSHQHTLEETIGVTTTPLPQRQIKKKGKKNEMNTNKRNNENIRVTLLPDKTRKVEESSIIADDAVNIDFDTPNFRRKPYLNPYKIQKWLNEKIIGDDFYPASQGGMTKFDEISKFAIKSAPIFDRLTRALYDIQVWQFYINLGTKQTQKSHWAKEVVRLAKTRDQIKVQRVCENKILKSNETIIHLRDEIALISDQLNIDRNSNTYEDVMFQYMNQVLTNIRRQCELKIKIAKTERAEHVAWEQFQQVATPTQKTLSNMIKAQLLKTREKTIRYELAAAHATPQIRSLPKILPALNLRFRFDETIMSDEQIKDIYESMDSITSDYRLKATELYIRTTKIELDYHNDRVKQLLEGSVLAVSEQSDVDDDTTEAEKVFQLFRKAHHHHTSALAEMKVLFLEEHAIKDAPDPLIQVSDLLSLASPIQEIIQLNNNK